MLHSRRDSVQDPLHGAATLRPMEEMFIAYGTTALELLRIDRETPGGIFLPADNSSHAYSPTAPSTPAWKEAESALRFLGCRQPYHMLVKRQNDRRRSTDALRTHFMATPPAGTAFPRITRTLYTSPPELCLLQLACELDEIELLGVAYEMCGYYTRAECGKESPRKLSPATDPEKIGACLSASKGIHGKKPLAKVSKNILAGSRSVKETQMALQFCLPPHLQGFALPQPRLNYVIGIPLAERPMLGASCYTADLCWPEKHLVLEYDSEAFHGESRRRADADRRNGLRYLGFTVVEANASDLATTFDAARMAQRIATIMGVEAKTGQFDVTAGKIAAHGRIMAISNRP